MKLMVKHYHIRVFGRVQNVGYRFHARKTAQRLGLTGYVMNRPDGSVIIRAEGEESLLDEMVSWCRTGPDWAEVERLEVDEEPLEGFTDFQVR